MYSCQTSNIDTLCCSVVAIAQQHCPAVVPQATEIESKFKKVFTLFHNCHQLYDSGVLDDTEVATLGRHNTVICKRIYHYFFSYRHQHQELRDSLQGGIPRGYCTPKNALSGRACGTMAEEVEDWLWFYGRTGGRVNTCLLQYSTPVIP